MALAAPPSLRPSTVYRRLMHRLPIRYADLRRAGGAVAPPKFNQHQERLWPAVAAQLDRMERIRLIVLKARQVGTSTWIECLLLAMSLLNDYAQSLVVAQDKTATGRIWNMAKLAVEQSPLRRVARALGHEIQCRHS